MPVTVSDIKTASGTILHNVHRKRRAAISPWFSKRSITMHEPCILAQVEALCETIKKQFTCNGMVELRVNFSAYTTDVVCSYVFDGSLGLLKDTKRALEWKTTISAVAALTPLIKQFPWIIPVVKSVPISVLRCCVPDLSRVIELHKVCMHCRRRNQYHAVSCFPMSQAESWRLR